MVISNQTINLLMLCVLRNKIAIYLVHFQEKHKWNQRVNNAAFVQVSSRLKILFFSYGNSGRYGDATLGLWIKNCLVRLVTSGEMHYACFYHYVLDAKEWVMKMLLSACRSRAQMLYFTPFFLWMCKDRKMEVYLSVVVVVLFKVYIREGVLIFIFYRWLAFFVNPLILALICCN